VYLVVMSGFPSLQPAFTVRAKLDPSMQVGSASRGTPLAIVPMVGGYVKSEPGFMPTVDAELHGVGYDYIRADASGTHLRLDVRAQLKDTSGDLIAMFYKGPLAFSEGVKKVITGAADAKTTGYGDSFMTFEFETGSNTFKPLETMVFCASGRFVMEGGETFVEYKVSRVEG